MDIVVINKESPQYMCDVIFRVYPNQGPKPHNEKEFFMYEVLTRSGIGGSENVGRYSSEHPQAVRIMAEKVINEFSDTEFVIYLSNEWPSYGKFGHFHEWFKSAFSSISFGGRYDR